MVSMVHKTGGMPMKCSCPPIEPALSFGIFFVHEVVAPGVAPAGYAHQPLLPPGPIHPIPRAPLLPLPVGYSRWIICSFSPADPKRVRDSTRRELEMPLLDEIFDRAAAEQQRFRQSR